MAENRFAPKPGAFGVIPIGLFVGPIGGRAGSYGVSAIVESTTTTFQVATPYRRFYVRGASVQQRTLTASGGTITAVLQKVSTGGTTTTQITAALSLQTPTATANVAIPFSVTATESARHSAASDIFQFLVTASGTIAAEPSDLFFNVEADVQD